MFGGSVCAGGGMVDGPLRQSGTETRYPWGNHQPGEVRDTSCAAFRCRSPGSSGKPGDLPVGAVINRPPHRGPDGHRRADRGGSSVIKNNLPALGAAGGWDIRWRNKRGILPAQMLCILRQVRWSGFPRLWQPIDSIVALQSAAPHFRAAKRTIQTNLLLFRYPQKRDLGKPRVFPVLSPAAKEDLSIIFGRRFFIGLFTTDAAIIELGASILIIIACTTHAQTTGVIMAGCLRGAGDTRFVALTSLISILFVRTAVSWVLCYPLQLGLIGAWLGLLLDQFTRMIINSIRFASGKWTKIKV